MGVAFPIKEPTPRKKPAQLLKTVGGCLGVIAYFGGLWFVGKIVIDWIEKKWQVSQWWYWVVLAILCAFVTGLVLFLMGRRLVPRLMEPVIADPESWRAAFTGQDPERQLHLLHRLSEDRFGLSTSAYLKLLCQVEGDLEGSEAEEYYWKHRATIEAALRQDSIESAGP